MVVGVCWMLTISLLALGSGASADTAGLLQVDVPGALLAFGVLEGEGEDAVALLHGGSLVGVTGGQSAANHVESGGSGESWIGDAHYCGSVEKKEGGMFVGSGVVRVAQVVEWRKKQRTRDEKN